MRLYKYFKKLFSCVASQKDTRFYYLSLMKNSNNKNGYSIHGLWPQHSLQNYPSYCREVSFDVNKLEPLKKDLYKYWNTKKFNSAENFWKHEYTKHGSCMFTNMNELEYFKTVL